MNPNALLPRLAEATQAPSPAQAASVPPALLLESGAVSEFAAAVAVHEVTFACVDAIRGGATLTRGAPTADGTVTRLVAHCSGLVGDEPRSSAALLTLAAFFDATVLADRRIVIDEDRLARAVDALTAAAADHNRAAFETLLRRSLRLLSEPLLAR